MTTQEPPAPPHSYTLAVGVFIAGLATALFGILPLRNWDTWWHLAAGDVIATFDAVPLANRFTFGVAADTPSIFHEWLAQLTMSKINLAYGMEGLLTTRNLLFFLTLLIITLAPKELSERARLLGAAAAAVLLSMSMFATPPMFVAPLFALCALAVWRLSTSTNKGVLIAAMLIPPTCTLLWANMDIAYGLPALLTAYATGRAACQSRNEPGRTMRIAGWGVSTVACLLVPLLNPRGAALIPHTIEVLTLYPMHPDAPLWSHLFTLAHAPKLALVLLSAGAVVAGWRGKTRAQIIPDAVLLVSLVFLAATHLRAIMWFGVCLPFLLAPGILAHAKLEKRESPSKKKAIAFFLLGLSLLSLTQPLFLWRAPLIEPLAGALNLRTVQPHQYSIDRNVPVESVELLAQQSVAPRVWASKKYEGYVLYRLLPKRVKPLTLTDLRLELIPADVSGLRQVMREDEDLWRGIFQGFDVGAALLDEREDSALVQALKDHADWQLVHTQGDTHYFVRVLLSQP